MFTNTHDVSLTILAACLANNYEIISIGGLYNKTVMVNYMDGPDLGALSHRWGKAPSGCK